MIGAARTRLRFAFGASVVCVALFAGLAAGSSPAATATGAADGPVAVIGSATISRASFDHWMTVANDAGQASSGKVAPAVPVPPDYTACVASLRGQPANSGTADMKLAAQCAKNYRTLVSEVMNFLIQAVWIEGEANARGVAVTAAQIDASYRKQRRDSNPPLATAAELDAFLASSGQTLADLKWRTRLNLLATAVELDACATAPPSAPRRSAPTTRPTARASRARASRRRGRDP